MVKGYLTTKEIAEMLGLSDARIRQMVLDGTIEGAEKVGRDVLIPAAEAVRLKDRPKPGRPVTKKAEKDD